MVPEQSQHFWEVQRAPSASLWLCQSLGTVPGRLPPPGKAGHGAAHAGAPPLGTDRHLQLFVSIQHTHSAHLNIKPLPKQTQLRHTHTQNPFPFMRQKMSNSWQSSHAHHGTPWRCSSAEATSRNWAKGQDLLFLPCYLQRTSSSRKRQDRVLTCRKFSCNLFVFSSSFRIAMPTHNIVPAKISTGLNTANSMACTSNPSFLLGLHSYFLSKHMESWKLLSLHSKSIMMTLFLYNISVSLWFLLIKKLASSNKVHYSIFTLNNDNNKKVKTLITITKFPHLHFGKQINK